MGVTESDLEYFRVSLKERYGVDHVEDVFGIVTYPNYMCDQIDRIRDMFGRSAGYVREFEELQELSMDYSDEEYAEFLEVVSDLYGKVVDEFSWYDSDIADLFANVERLIEWVSGLLVVGDLAGLDELPEFDHLLDYELDRLRAECEEVDRLGRFGSDISRMERLAVYSLDDGSIVEDLRREVERVRALGISLRLDILAKVYDLVEESGYSVVESLKVRRDW